MFELVKLHKELTKMLGGSPHNISLIISENSITLKLYRRGRISNTQITTMTEMLIPYKLKIGTVRAVSHGVLSNEVGLEIYILPLK